MKCIWDRIHVWLKANAPLVLASLRPGATEERIRAAERELGVTLPEGVKACYRIHDGQNNYHDGRPLGFLYGHPWCGLERMVKEWRKLNEGYLGRDADYCSALIPLTTTAWDQFYVIDLVAGSDGFGVRWADTNAGFYSTPVAYRFDEWFATFAADLERGRYVVHPEIGYLHEVNP